MSLRARLVRGGQRWSVLRTLLRELTALRVATERIANALAAQTHHTPASTGQNYVTPGHLGRDGVGDHPDTVDQGPGNVDYVDAAALSAYRVVEHDLTALLGRRVDQGEVLDELDVRGNNPFTAA